MLRKVKLGISMIILGELLYFIQLWFPSNSTNFIDFIQGLILGLSIGINIIGIILTIYYLSHSK